MDDAVVVRDLGAEDTGALIACIRACYGDSYPDREFYDARHLRDELQSGRLLCVGAVEHGRVVGNIGAKVRNAGPVADMVAGMVHPEYRGRGLTAAIGAQVVDRLRDAGIAGVRQFATGAHDRTQRLIVASGGVPTGVLLGHVVAGTDYRQIEHRFGDARIGVVVYFQTYGDLDPLDVHLPDRYSWAATIYDELKLRRRVLRPHDRGRDAEDPGGSIDHDRWQRITQVKVGAVAGSPRRPLQEVLDAMAQRFDEVTYVDVPLADPRTGSLFDILKDEGFVFGAILPGTAATETVRLQRVAPAVVAPTAIVTASDSGRHVLDRIVAEHEGGQG